MAFEHLFTPRRLQEVMVKGGDRAEAAYFPLTPLGRQERTEGEWSNPGFLFFPAIDFAYIRHQCLDISLFRGIDPVFFDLDPNGSEKNPAFFGEAKPI